MQNFRRLYDRSPNFSLKGLSLSEKYSALGIEENNSFSISLIKETLCNRILFVLEPVDNNYITNFDLNNLRDAFFFSTKLFGNPEDWQYFIAMHELLSIIGAHKKKYVPFTNEVAWSGVLKYLRCYMDLEGVPDEYSLLIGLEEQQHRISAIKNLERKGRRYQGINRTVPSKLYIRQVAWS